MKVVILGSGNVAHALLEAIKQANRSVTDNGRAHHVEQGPVRDTIELVQIYARDRERGRALAEAAGVDFTDSLSGLAPANLYVIAVSDNAVAEVAGRMILSQATGIEGVIATHTGKEGDSRSDLHEDISHDGPHESVAEAINRMNLTELAVVAHTAGSVSIEALSPHADRAVIYPLLTFTSGREVDFEQIPVFIEYSTPHAATVARNFAEMLSHRVWEISAGQRAALHLAAVFASNFTNSMFAIAGEIASLAELPFEILKPLIAETAAKALSTDYPALMQTGPAVRGDSLTMERHLALLGEMGTMDEMDGMGGEKRAALLKEIYETVSRNIWETSKRR